MLVNNYQNEDGDYDEPCLHIVALREYLEEAGLRVWSERGEPQGWVNVYCEMCDSTKELMLRPVEDEDED